MYGPKWWLTHSQVTTITLSLSLFLSLLISNFCLLVCKLRLWWWVLYLDFGENILEENKGIFVIVVWGKGFSKFNEVTYGKGRATLKTVRCFYCICLSIQSIQTQFRYTCLVCFSYPKICHFNFVSLWSWIDFKMFGNFKITF